MSDMIKENDNENKSLKMIGQKYVFILHVRMDEFYKSVGLLC